MVHYDPYMPEIMDDPYPIYAQLRAESPVYYVERFDAWALALFEDIWSASFDEEHFTTRNATADRPFLEREPSSMETLTSLDPPKHTVLRKQLFPHFGPAAARSLEPRIRGWARDCIAKHEGAGRIDAVAELAQQVAVRVACTIGGFPVDDADYLIDLVARFFRREEGTEGQTEASMQARDEMHGYLAAAIEKRRSEGPVGGANSIDTLLGAEIDEEGPFSPERVQQHLTLLLIGATETFPKVFASGLLRLAQHPDQRRDLAADPAFIPTALTEILRFDMPTQWLGRTAKRDLEVRGHKIKAGQPVMFLYPSANRDELEFDEPDRFDIRRAAPRILTFGSGTHMCLGAFMARMEGKVLLEEVLGRFPDYEVLHDELVKPPTEFVQGYSNFPIAFEPRG